MFRASDDARDKTGGKHKMAVQDHSDSRNIGNRWAFSLSTMLLLQVLGASNVLAEELPSTVPEPAPVWRFWSPVHLRHFYTADASEKNKLLTNYPTVWTYEMVAYRVPEQDWDLDPVPVYRFWSDRLRSHFYTLNEAERDKLINNYSHVWTYEGVVFHAYPASRRPTATLPVYRFWSAGLEAHFYTASQAERYKLTSLYSDVWEYEGVGWYAYPAGDPLSSYLVKGPYLQNVAPDSVTVMWETSVAVSSRLGYGLAEPDESFVEDADAATLHKMELANLAPDTTYVYQILSGGAAGSIGAFTTAPRADRPFRFAVYGDSRTYPDAHKAVVQSMIDSGPEIVLHVGDIVTAGRDYERWGTEFFEPARDLLSTTPVVPALGNHEYAGVGPLWFSYFFDLPSNETWFAVTYGNTRLIALDTNVDYSPGSPQHDWLVAELTSGQYLAATWHVVFFHHPPFTATVGHSDNLTVQSQLVPLFEQHAVDIAFQGHSHACERYVHNGVHYIVTGGGGGPLYALADDCIDPLRLFGSSAYHHCIVDVDSLAGTLTVTAIDTVGEAIDCVELCK